MQCEGVYYGKISLSHPLNECMGRQSLMVRCLKAVRMATFLPRLISCLRVLFYLFSLADPSTLTSLIHSIETPLTLIFVLFSAHFVSSWLPSGARSLIDLHFLHQTRLSATAMLSGLLNPATQSAYLTAAATRKYADLRLLLPVQIKLRQIEAR